MVVLWWQEYLRNHKEGNLQELNDGWRAQRLESRQRDQHGCALLNPFPAPCRYLFEGVELTAREKADLAYKQRVYELALERKQALEGLVDDGYSMPTNYGE